MLKNFNMKNIKMRPPVSLFNLFKKSSMILYLFLKAKSQSSKSIYYQDSCMLFAQEERRKENC